MRPRQAMQHDVWRIVVVKKRQMVESLELFDVRCDRRNDKRAATIGACEHDSDAFAPCRHAYGVGNRAKPKAHQKARHGGCDEAMDIDVMVLKARNRQRYAKHHRAHNSNDRADAEPFLQVDACAANRERQEGGEAAVIFFADALSDEENQRHRNDNWSDF